MGDIPPEQCCPGLSAVTGLQQWGPRDESRGDREEVPGLSPGSASLSQERSLKGAADEEGEQPGEQCLSETR